MEKRGKTITLFLMDGDHDGWIRCKLSNRPCLAYKIPRTELNTHKDSKDTKRNGVYCLFGKRETDGKDFVYIGQADKRALVNNKGKNNKGKKDKKGFLARLKEHINDKKIDYWTEAIVFTDSTDSFGSSELDYLENKFWKLAKEAKRYHVENKKEPYPSNQTDELIEEMEDYIEDVKLIMTSLGHNLFEPLCSSESDDDNLLYISRKVTGEGELKATGFQNSNGFVLCKGCKIAKTHTSISPELKYLRDEAHKNGTIKDSVLMNDVQFSSPSAAAKFVFGRSENGRTKWMNKSGKSLADLESEKTK